MQKSHGEGHGLQEEVWGDSDIGTLSREIITAYAAALGLDPRLCIIIRLDLTAQDEMFLMHVGRKRYGFGYLSLLSV